MKTVPIWTYGPLHFTIKNSQDVKPLQIVTSKTISNTFIKYFWLCAQLWTAVKLHWNNIFDSEFFLNFWQTYILQSPKLASRNIWHGTIYDESPKTYKISLSDFSRILKTSKKTCDLSKTSSWDGETFHCSDFRFSSPFLRKLIFCEKSWIIFRPKFPDFCENVR